MEQINKSVMEIPAISKINSREVPEEDPRSEKIDKMVDDMKRGRSLGGEVRLKRNGRVREEN